MKRMYNKLALLILMLFVFTGASSVSAKAPVCTNRFPSDCFGTPGCPSKQSPCACDCDCADCGCENSCFLNCGCMNDCCENGCCENSCCENGCCENGCCENSCCENGCCENGCCENGCCENGGCCNETPEAPETDVPDVDVPDVDIPDTDAPDVDVPDVEIPDVEIPDIEVPDVDVPEVEVPESDSTPESGILDLEQQVVALVNQERASRGLPALTISAQLCDGARLKSRDMLENNYFDHNSPTYGSPFDMMQSLGITYSAAGENIAMGYSTAEAVMNGWMNSEGHRANILSENYTHIGVGYVDGYWTQWFTR